MKIHELKYKTVKELNTELLSLLREQFNLRMQVKDSQIQQTHLLKEVRRSIARVKTLLSLKTGVHNDG